MKKSLILVLSLAVALAFAAMVVAQTNPPETPPAKPAPAQQTNPPEKPVVKPETKASVKPEAKPAGKPAVAKERKIMGTVVSVDAVANTIVVKLKDTEKTFKVDPSAKIMPGGKKATLADIVRDTKITITYKIVGKDRIALGIK